MCQIADSAFSTAFSTAITDAPTPNSATATRAAFREANFLDFYCLSKSQTFSTISSTFAGTMRRARLEFDLAFGQRPVAMPMRIGKPASSESLNFTPAGVAVIQDDIHPAFSKFQRKSFRPRFMTSLSGANSKRRNANGVGRDANGPDDACCHYFAR